MKQSSTPELNRRQESGQSIVPILRWQVLTVCAIAVSQRQ